MAVEIFSYETELERGEEEVVEVTISYRSQRSGSSWSRSYDVELESVEGPAGELELTTDETKAIYTQLWERVADDWEGHDDDYGDYLKGLRDDA